MDEWVVDAGPFIHLDQIGHLSLLQKLPRLLVPPSVVEEVTAHTHHRSLSSLSRWPNVTVSAAVAASSRPLEALVARARLHRGEADCLAVALAHRPCVFLTDDLAARTVGERLRLEVHGTVGLVAYALRRKWLSLADAEEALEALYHRSRLFISYAIIERAIRSLREQA